MAQTTSLINTLKTCLKGKGKTYVDVASALGLTEASVKRLFAEKNFSLTRLDQVCQLLEIEISDLVKLMSDTESQRLQSRLSVEQEQDIASDLGLLLITVNLLNGWTVAEIVDNYRISEITAIKHLSKLDRLKIIELLPNNKVKLLVAANFSWRKNGPIQRLFLQTIQKDFFNTRFEQNNENLIVLNGMLSDAAIAVLQKKMKKVAAEFNELNSDEAHLPIGERNGATLLMAMRPWDYHLFSQVKEF